LGARAAFLRSATPSQAKLRDTLLPGIREELKEYRQQFVENGNRHTRGGADWRSLRHIMETNSVHWTELGFDEDAFLEALALSMPHHSPVMQALLDVPGWTQFGQLVGRSCASAISHKLVRPARRGLSPRAPIVVS
jgi:hypothetical protein